MIARRIHLFLYMLALQAALAMVTPAFGIELRAFDASSMQTIRSQHAGGPFVVAFWSITCEPCRKEMQDWKKLLQKYPGLPVIFVTTDGPSDRSAVLDFIRQYSARGVEHWAFADSYGERLRYSIDPAWRGELPRTYFYDASQKVQGRSGRLDMAWIEGWIGRQMGAARTAETTRRQAHTR